MKQSHIIIFYHFAKSRDMVSRCPLFWRAFVLLIFGSKVQAHTTVLQALRIAKVEKQTTTFMKLHRPWSDCGQLLKEILVLIRKFENVNKLNISVKVITSLFYKAQVVSKTLSFLL